MMIRYPIETRHDIAMSRRNYRNYITNWTTTDLRISANEYSGILAGSSDIRLSVYMNTIDFYYARIRAIANELRQRGLARESAEVLALLRK